MSQKQVGWAVLCLSVGVVSPAWGQAAQVEASASTEGGTSAKAEESGKFEPYEAGYPPDNNLLEIGVFGGALFPSSDHNLRDERFPQQPYRVAPELGGRLGYFPLSFLGIEGEAMGALSHNKNDKTKADLFAGRGSLVVQIPLPYVTPFALGGVGKLGA